MLWKFEPTRTRESNKRQINAMFKSHAFFIKRDIYEKNFILYLNLLSYHKPQTFLKRVLDKTQI